MRAIPSTEAVTELWAQILGVDSLASHDCVLAKGANSLNVMQFINRAFDTFGRRLGIREVYAESTSVAMAAKLSAISHESEQPSKLGASVSIYGNLLSPAQRHFYLEAEKRPDAPFLFLPLMFRIRGDLNLVALRESFQLVSQQHESLRSCFVRVADRIERHILKAAPVELEQFSLASDLQQERQLESASHFVRKHIKAGMNVSVAPLYKVWTSKLENKDHVLVVIVHHIIMDGYGIGLWLRELAYVYSTIISGRGSLITRQGPQDSDYIAWHRHYFDSSRRADCKASFRHMLGGARLAVPLPTMSPRADALADMEGYLSVHVPTEVVAIVRRAAVDTKSSVFSILIAVWNVVLYHYTGATDVVIRVAGSSRDRTEFRPIVGMLWTPLFVRCKFSAKTEFNTLIDCAREAVSLALHHQHLSTEDARAALMPENDLDTTPPNFHFTLHDDRLHNAFALTGLEVETLRIPVTDHGADIKVHLQVGKNDRLVGHIVYRSDLFAKKFIEQLFNDFIGAIKALMNDRLRQVGAVELKLDRPSI
jgi:hypothetical protein